jgi:hypothetical protein
MVYSAFLCASASYWKKGVVFAEPNRAPEFLQAFF